MAAPASDAILDRLLQLHPKIIDLTLGRVERLLEAMNHPERRLPPVVHVAGTNGKGSVIAMLRAGLEAAGRRVHVYSSPHLVRFHERIRLAGELISEPELAALLEACEAANGAEQITFFEITTVAAMVAFARTPADWLLLEVGLGGRLDATNVVDAPALTVITPVSLDHQQYLGDTLPEIAGEKAGILKPGVPCVVGPQASEALAVIRTRAEAVGTPLLEAGRDWHVRAEAGALLFEDARGSERLPLPSLPGAHQQENAGIAVAALRALGEGSETSAALAEAKWPARMQRLRQGPLVDLLPKDGELWLDGGHNPAAGEALASVLAEISATSPRPLWLVVGMLDTKAAADFLRPLASVAQGIRTVAIPGADASFSAGDLAAIATGLGAEAAPAPDVAHAVREIVDRAAAPPRIAICGSLYLAGRVLRDNGS